MKGLVRIEKENLDFANLFNSYETHLEYGPLGYGYSICIHTDLKEGYDSLILQEGKLLEQRKRQLEFIMADGCDNEYTKDLYNFFSKTKGKEKETLEKAEFVNISASLVEVIAYINNNPSLKLKKIIFDEIPNLSREILDKIKEELGMSEEQLFFKLPNNQNVYSYKEIYETLLILDNIVKEIERFEFSDFEKIMYAYDWVRNRMYVEEPDNVYGRVSRDLTPSLLGKYIVCEGFANIFCAILKQMNIKAEVVYYDCVDNPERGHARVSAFIKDDKYDITGVYYFDPTANCKDAEHENMYLMSYSFFAKTKAQMDSKDQNDLTEVGFPYFSEDMHKEFIELYKNGGIKNVPAMMIKSFNRMACQVYNNNIFDSICYYIIRDDQKYWDEDEEKLENLVFYFDSPISAQTFLKALFEVRKVQYYQNPLYYPFGNSDFYQICKISQWEFDPMLADEFLNFISGIKSDTKQSYKRFGHSEDYFKKIDQVRLARTLRCVYDKKSKER